MLMKSAIDKDGNQNVRHPRIGPEGGMSIREVADALGLTRQQVVEAEKRAKLKLERAGLRDWL